MRCVSIKLNGILAVLLDSYIFAVFHLIYTIFRLSFKDIQGHFHDSRPLQRGFTIP